MKKKEGFVLWFTGIPCSGKTTLADTVADILKEKKLKVERLDGDVIRKNLSHDLGFSKEDREANLKRVCFVANLLSRNEIAVLASFVSPYKEIRQHIRLNTTNFIEVYVKCSPKTCAERDIKGMWVKAKKGEIKNFTGYDAPYEEPTNAELTIDTETQTVEKCTKQIIKYLRKRKLI